MHLWSHIRRIRRWHTNVRKKKQRINEVREICSLLGNGEEESSSPDNTQGSYSNCGKETLQSHFPTLEPAVLFQYQRVDLPVRSWGGTVVPIRFEDWASTRHWPSGRQWHLVEREDLINGVEDHRWCQTSDPAFDESITARSVSFSSRSFLFTSLERDFHIDQLEQRCSRDSYTSCRTLDCKDSFSRWIIVADCFSLNQTIVDEYWRKLSSSLGIVITEEASSVFQIAELLMIADRSWEWQSSSTNHCMPSSTFDFLALVLIFLLEEEQRSSLRLIDVHDKFVQSISSRTVPPMTESLRQSSVYHL